MYYYIKLDNKVFLNVIGHGSNGQKETRSVQAFGSQFDNTGKDLGALPMLHVFLEVRGCKPANYPYPSCYREFLDR